MSENYCKKHSYYYGEDEELYYDKFCVYCEIERLKEENKRYRKALERVAVCDEYTVSLHVAQEIAREALNENAMS